MSGVQIDYHPLLLVGSCKLAINFLERPLLPPTINYGNVERILPFSIIGGDTFFTRPGDRTLSPSHRVSVPVHKSGVTNETNLFPLYTLQIESTRHEYSARSENSYLVSYHLDLGNKKYKHFI